MNGPSRMDWADYAAARTYLTEMRVGVLVREAARAEDAEFHESRKHMER